MRYFIFHGHAQQTPHMKIKPKFKTVRITHVFNHTDDAWDALKKYKRYKKNWFVGSYGGYENCLWTEKEIK